MTRPFANFMGIDDGPFPPGHRGDVTLVGTMYTQHRLDGVITGKARCDGRNATDRIAAMIRESKFEPRVILVGGIAVGGFNVIDLQRLHAELSRPVLVVARRRPNLTRIREALLTQVPGGARKWRLIEQARPMERAGAVWVQRAGLTLPQAEQVLRDSTLHGKIPEPLRVAHLVAGALVDGQSRGRA
jgi:endonuclease V-like protein UPF0215 family